MGFNSGFKGLILNLNFETTFSWVYQCNGERDVKIVFFERPQIVSPRIIRNLSKISFNVEFRFRFWAHSCRICSGKLWLVYFSSSGYFTFLCQFCSRNVPYQSHRRLSNNSEFRICKSVHLYTFKWINQPDAAISQVYCLSFKYSLTCFRYPHVHHQELNNRSSNLWFTVGTWW